jgi:hypothetical protein
MNDDSMAAMIHIDELLPAYPLTGDEIEVLPEPPLTPETRTDRRRTAVNVAAACAPAVLYLLYVRHYSVNLPFSDDWTKAQLVVSAIHGHVDVGAMWKQYAEARLFLPNFVFVAIGRVDDFNLQTIITLSALALIASYALLLVSFRDYLARPLTPLAILSVGVIWFSLADTGNALWAFQFAWYLVLFFLAVMLFLLLRRPDPTVWFTGAAIVAAVAASYSMLQGFVLWPVGLLCLVWTWRRTRTHVVALGCWLSAAALTFAVYVRGYDHSLGCVSGQPCSVGNVAGRPAHYGRFFVALPGYVVPKVGPFDRSDYSFHLLLGLALLAGATVVIVQSLRERRRTRGSPLPVALITFALLFDATIAIGRGAGRIAAASQSRFTMANIVLVTGIVIYAWAHVPTWRSIRDRAPAASRAGFVAFGALALFVIAQTVFTTQSGITEARAWHRIQVTEARVLVHRRSLPPAQLDCYLRVFVTNSGTRNHVRLVQWLRYVHAIGREGLYVFEPAAWRKYDAQGPPVVPGVCMLPSATQVVPQRAAR